MLRPAGKNRILFCAAATQHQVFHAVDVEHLSGVDVSIEHDHLHVLGVGRDHLVRIVRGGDGAEARPGEHRVVEGDEGLLDALGLGLVQPLLHLLHLLRILRPIAIPQRGRPLVVLAAPQKNEASALEVELVDEVLRRDAELLQIRHGAQHALDLGIAPHLVIA